MLGELVTSKKLLRQKSEIVDVNDPETIELINELEDYLAKDDKAAGISACQFGVFKKVCSIKTNEGIISFANPKVVERLSPYIFEGEGCLSFPGVYLNTIRYNKLKVVDDLQGETALQRFSAAVAEHEIDHGEGILFYDRMRPDKYESCFCGSEKKFKFCCFDLVK